VRWKHRNLSKRRAQRIKRNPVKSNLVTITFKKPVRTSKGTQDFTITKINLLMLFKEIIPVYSEKHKKFINTKYGVIDC
jgi:hypothetical protein